MRPQAPLNLTAQPHRIARDNRVSRDRGHALAPKLTEDVLPNRADEFAGPAGSDYPNMNIGAFEVVEQDTSHDLAISL